MYARLENTVNGGSIALKLIFIKTQSCKLSEIWRNRKLLLCLITFKEFYIYRVKSQAVWGRGLNSTVQYYEPAGLAWLCFHYSRKSPVIK